VLTIKPIVDQEDGIDEIDVLGDLLISDTISTIVLKTTFLDSWLGALIEANAKLRDAGELVVNVSEELVPIQMHLKSDGRVVISYENRMVLAESPEAVDLALKDAAKSLLETVGNLPRSRMNTVLESIRLFSENEHGPEIN
jgi:hypothetical protein